jgi:hypothetical protein
MRMGNSPCLPTHGATGFCLLQFVGRGYDEITLKSPGQAPV